MLPATAKEFLVAVSSTWSGLFVEHPVAPAEGVDPLASGWPVQPVAASEHRLRIGYAAFWEQEPKRTWSGSTWHLREALRGMADTVDIGVEFPALTRNVLKGLHTRYRGGRLTTSWCYSRLTDAYVERALRRGIRNGFGDEQYDAAIMIDSIADLPEPFYAYYDSSWDLLMSGSESLKRYAAVRRISTANVRRRRDREIAIYQRAAGIFAESRWLARSLAEQSGIDPAKIHIAPPAIVAGRGDDTARSLPDRDGPRRKLLFVGRMYEHHDFYRKGGDLVVRALAVLRRDYDPEITLTVVGTDAWPLPGDVPDGVDFRGVMPPSEVKKLYDSSDLFVMPSRMEPFGLVFAEALSRGLPCVARNACAMPEIVTDGVSGALISKDDEYELAAAVASVLADDQIYKNCKERAPRIAEYFSWERTASDMIRVIGQAGSRTA
jgi:glycosyltransferase involved in cell wall biosynthesis